MKMHICLVMAGDEEGGLEKHVVELAGGLVERGHHVSLISHEKYRLRLHQNINFYAVNLAKGRRNAFVLFQLWYTIKQIKPDVLHVHGNKAAFMVGFLLRYLSIKSVATLHSRKKNTKMFKPFDQVIAVSNIAAVSILHPRVTVILNGIEPPIIKQRHLQFPPLVLAVGRLVPVKGFDVLLKAWSHITEPAQLWIAGDGPERQTLENLINTLNIEQSVQLLGHQKDINLLMQQATIHVICSHYEGGPYTLSEALLVGTPVVGTKVGMLPDFVSQKYLIETNNHNELSRLLSQALQQPEQLLMDFNDAFNNAKAILTFEHMITKVISVYKLMEPSHELK